MNSPSPDPLENLIDRTLRSTPDRRAPVSLEARVLAALARREALPWWRRSWNCWPRSAQTGFLVGSAALVVFVITSGVALAPGVEQALTDEVPGVRALFAFGGACQEVLNTMAELVPVLWRCVALAVVAAGCCALTGLGVAAYRTLSPQRE